MLRSRCLMVAALAGLAFNPAAVVCAQSESTAIRVQPPAWAALTPAQQTALQPLQNAWHTIDTEHKRKWMEIADRFTLLSDVERARVQGRMAEWAQLSPNERKQVRLNYLQTQNLTPQERSTKWEAYQALPTEKREEFLTRARVVPPPVKASSPKIISSTQVVDPKTLLPKAPQQASTAPAVAASAPSRP